MYNRREFIKVSALGAISTLPLVGLANSLLLERENVHAQLELLVFSKHLQFLNYTELCEAAKNMGFDGIDLTVRPKGHVLPENVAVDLPKATEAIKAAGLKPRMITTSVTDSNNSLDATVVKIASEQGYPYYRMGWYKYPLQQPVLEELNGFAEKISGLSVLNNQMGITGTYQNHSGKYMGSALWDLNQAMEGIKPEYLGSQYDITHAMIDGGLNWEVGFHLIKNHINSLVIKDFNWELVNGQWKAVYTPIGEGMVDFKRFFSLLKKHNIYVPVSMHFEYPLGGAEKGNREITVDKNIVFEALKKDVTLIKKLWNEAIPE